MNSTEQALETHEHRITALEQAQEQTQKRIDAIERSHNDLKVTIMEENRDTRRFLQNLVERKVVGDEDDRAREDDIRRERNAGIKDILLGIFGAGGIVALILQFLLGN